MCVCAAMRSCDTCRKEGTQSKPAMRCLFSKELLPHPSLGLCLFRKIRHSGGVEPREKGEPWDGVRERLLCTQHSSHSPSQQLGVFSRMLLARKGGGHTQRGRREWGRSGRG